MEFHYAPLNHTSAYAIKDDKPTTDLILSLITANNGCILYSQGGNLNDF